ncbi:hypothetical protein PAXRUDRAFT_23989 [Paxillus rubicundulus Ve08.2h10]|uniref:Uncharacterized protein n=1 Tax=Paxillus rubicundulus Ve08.2h10 TaxID=930991 RepID=A0A0D0DVJ6_9AGAM|nr:hypothetical protein PAXRUDRAFT_23989 [Paxillus rubicundulus Ve08.2h10]
MPPSSAIDTSVDPSSKLTVHDFVVDLSIMTSSQAFKLEQGRAIASASSSGNRWATPHSTVGPSMFAVEIRTNKLYEYTLKPPQLNSGKKLSDSESIPPWGVPSTDGDHDYFRLQDLEEFESTDFRTVMACHSCLQQSDLATFQLYSRGKRVSDTDIPLDGPVKRLRLNTSSIVDLIPQPHFIPSPTGKFEPVDTSKIAPYRKIRPSPIPPYDKPTVTQLMASGSRRGAWFIPVRGSLPWDGATMAVLLEPSQGASLALGVYPSGSAIEHVTTCKIMWTRESVQDLWMFLKSIQEGKNLGPISLSFHAAPAEAVFTSDTASEPAWESNNPYHPQHSSKQTAGFSDDFAAHVYRARLEGIDYIKVYHDVLYSLSLRNVLDAYRTNLPNRVGESLGRLCPSTKQKFSNPDHQKIRVLKGARLVFMDERSKAAFLLCFCHWLGSPIHHALGAANSLVPRPPMPTIRRDIYALFGVTRGPSNMLNVGDFAGPSWGSAGGSRESRINWFLICRSKSRTSFSIRKHTRLGFEAERPVAVALQTLFPEPELGVLLGIHGQVFL